MGVVDKIKDCEYFTWMTVVHGKGWFPLCSRHTLCNISMSLKTTKAKCVFFFVRFEETLSPMWCTTAILNIHSSSSIHALWTWFKQPSKLHFLLPSVILWQPLDLKRDSDFYLRIVNRSLWLAKLLMFSTYTFKHVLRVPHICKIKQMSTYCSFWLQLNDWTVII